MSDKNPYGLRNADIENLDLSEFAKDFNEDELSAVRSALMQKRQEQQEKFNALPILDQAKIYSGEKFGELRKAVEEDPLLLAAPFVAKSAIDVGTSTVKGAKSLYDRMINKPTPEGVSPTVPQVTPTETPVQTIPTAEQAAQQAAQQAVAEGKVTPGKAGGSITPQEGTILGNVESGKAKAAVSGVVKGAVAPKQTAAVDFEATLGKPTVTTGSGMPAYAGQGGEAAKMKKEFGSISDVPKGYVFVPGGQYMDITRNAVGQEAFTTKLGEFGGYPKTTEGAYEQSRAINKSLGRLSREEAKAAGVSVGDVTPSITKKVAGSKLVKVAGVGGALISLADVASAKEAAQTIGEMLLPIGMTPSELAPGTLYTPAQQREFTRQQEAKRAAERQKLGSPYRSVPPPK